MRFSLCLLALLPLASLAQPKEGASQTPALTNKQLFDRTIDELNFRTFETVYDKHYTRQKYPTSLRTAQARKEFTNFENNAELQKLFANYNGVAERYKTRFGNGQLTLAEFQKQLNSVLVDRNFEFFIRGLPRDEKTSLVRTEQRVIKQATAQFNASAEPAAAAPTEAPEQPLASVPLTTNGISHSEEAGPALPAAEVPERPAAAHSLVEEPAAASSSGPGWVGYFTLLLSLGSFGLLLYTAATLLPELRRLRARVRALEAEQAYDVDETPETAAPPVSGSNFFSQFRPQPTGELPDDKYEDDPHYPQ